MSNIVKAREILTRLVNTQANSLSPQHRRKLKQVLSLMHRKFNGRASTKSRKFTPAIAAQIRIYLRGHPDASYQDVATIYGVNIGRVTEAMRHG